MPPRSAAPKIEDKILKAALALFSKLGYANVTVPQIAARAKVGLQTLYRHFPSKEALGNAVFRKCRVTWASATHGDWPRDESPKVQFETYWSRLCAYAEKNYDVALYNEHTDLGHAFDAQSEALQAQLDRWTTDVLSSWIAAGYVKNLPEHVLKALIHGTFYRLLELRVSSAERLGLLRVAGTAIWDALATTEHRSAAAGKRSAHEAAARTRR